MQDKMGWLVTALSSSVDVFAVYTLQKRSQTPSLKNNDQTSKFATSDARNSAANFKCPHRGLVIPSKNKRIYPLIE